MRLVLSHHTALEFWLSSLSLYKSEFENNAVSGESSLEKAELSQFLTSLRRQIDGPVRDLEILVPAADDRLRISGVHCHVHGGPIASELLVCIGSNIHVVSPELCLMQLTNMHPAQEVVRMGTELCSLYAYPYNQWSGSPVERASISSKEVMSAFLTRHGKGHAGARAAGRALRYIVESTRSPRESTLASLLSLPSALGGQRMPGFVANPQVLLDKHSSKLTSRKYLEVDLYWPKQKVGIEYNSHLHDPNEAAYRDLEKITTLQTMGITIVPLNTQHMNDYESFSIILDSLRKRLGLRDRAPQEAQPARRETHFQLLAAEHQRGATPSLSDQGWWQALLPMVETGF